MTYVTYVSLVRKVRHLLLSIPCLIEDLSSSPIELEVGMHKQENGSV